MILQGLVSLCSDIQILELAPNDDLHYPDNLDPTQFDYLRFHAALEYQSTEIQPWNRSLSALTQLRTLTVSAGWFYPACLRALGRLKGLESLTVVPGSLDGFDHEFDIDSSLPDTAFPRLTKLTIVGLEVYGMRSFLSVEGMLHQVITMNLEFYFDYLDGGRYSEIEGIFDRLRNARHLRDLRIDFDFQSECGEYPANVSGAINEMGLHPLLDSVHLGGMRIEKELRRDPYYPCIRRLALVWPNVQTLSMPWQSASVRELEEFATLPSLMRLTLNLDLTHSYFPEKPSVPRAPLKNLISSGPVRLSMDYDDLCISAAAILRLWPSLECVSWSDKDPARMQLADFFNSKVLEVVRQSMFGKPRADAKLSAKQKLEEFKVIFEEIIEDVEETDGWNSDSDWDSSSEEELTSESWSGSSSE